MEMSYILEALKENGSKINDDHPLLNGLLHSLMSDYRSHGHANLDLLLDMNHLRMEKLMDDHGHFRKPRIFIYTRIIQRGNLALEWYPYDYGEIQALDDSDFCYFNDRSHFSDPPNRILFIKHVDELRACLAIKDKRKVAEQLAHVVEERIDDAIQFLRGHFEVTLCSKLNLIRKPNDSTGKITGIEIKNLKEEANATA